VSEKRAGMNRLRKVVNNTIISLAGQAVTWMSTLLLTIAYGRFLGDVKFGELYFAITFVLLIGFPVEVGFNQQITRDVAQEPGKALRYLSNILLIKATLWLVLYGLILLVCWLLGYSMEERILVGICGFTLLSTAIANTFAAVHYSFERAALPAVASILEKGLSACVGITLLRYGAGVQVMAIVLLSGSMINTLWQACWFFRLVGINFSLDRTLIRHLIQTSIPFLLYGILGVIYYRIDTILLSLMTNTAVVGWYGAAYRLFDTLLFLPNLLIPAIMSPVFSKLYVSSSVSLEVAVEKTTNFLLFCGIPIATILIVSAPNIIGFLYHRTDFSHSVPVLQALAPGLVLLYTNTVIGTVLVITKREKKIPLVAAIALVFNIGLNLILIPKYQHVGAAIVTSLTELLLVYLNAMFIPRNLLPLRSLRVGAKVIIASLVMGLIMLALRTLSILLLLPIAILVYIAVAMLLATIPREDLQALYNAIRSRSADQIAASSPISKQKDQEPQVIEKRPENIVSPEVSR
jgi:O-antigen/teichoic acid export membrane protein